MTRSPADLTALLATASTLADARPDLADRLRRAGDRLADPDVRVVFAGEIKQGKSRLLNALVNAPVCTVDDDVSTVIPTVLRHGAAPGALVRPAAPEGAVPYPIAPTAVADYVSERGNPGNRRDLHSVEVLLPRQILADGLVLVDSPGIGGLSSLHAVATLATLSSADAVLLVSDAGATLSEPELEFARRAARLCPAVACVVTKTDLHAKWRDVVARDAQLLDDVRPGMPVIPVSADLRAAAARSSDIELNLESGFPQLVAYLRDAVLGRAETLRRLAVTHEVVAVIDHLRSAVRAEIETLENPGAAGVVLERVVTSAGESTRGSAGWQVALNDGVGDLISDLEYDLRDRLRAIQHEAEESIDEGDPAPRWPEFVGWLEERIAAAVSETFVWTDERANWLATEIARRFGDQVADLPGFELASPEEAMDPVELVPDLDAGRLTVIEKVLVGMRGSYGGVLMVGLVTGVLGMALINPLSVGAGVLIGAKVYRDERAARLKRRQGEAKNIVRHVVDDVIFHVGKELKDRLRGVQRSCRDHFTALAEESRRTAADTARAVVRAERTADPDARLAELRERLSSLDGVRRQALELRRPRVPAERAT